MLRGLWSGEQVTHRGKHYVVDGVELKPRPVQERIPIWIGGNSPPALRRAARFDGWAADSESPEGMRLSPDDAGGQGRRHPGSSAARSRSTSSSTASSSAATRRSTQRSARPGGSRPSTTCGAASKRRSRPYAPARRASAASRPSTQPKSACRQHACANARGSRGAAAGRARRARGGSGRRARSAARARRSRRARARPGLAAHGARQASAERARRSRAWSARPAARQCRRLDGLAEQRDVGVVAAEDPPVERLLRRPDERRRRSCRCGPRVHRAYSHRMPEGDALHRAARRLQPLVGEQVEVETPNPRAQIGGIAEKLDGRRLLSVEAVGKNLLLRFEGGYVLRSHLRMNGRWTLVPARRRSCRGRPWLVLRGSQRRGAAVERAGARAPRARHPAARPGHPRAPAATSTRWPRASAAATQGARSATRSSTSGSSPGSGTSGRRRRSGRRGLALAAVSRDDRTSELHAVLDAAARLMRDSLDGRRRAEPRLPPASAARARAAASGSARAARATPTGSPTGVRLPGCR